MQQQASEGRTDGTIWDRTLKADEQVEVTDENGMRLPLNAADHPGLRVNVSKRRSALTVSGPAVN